MKPPACSPSHGPNAGCSRALGEGPSLGGASVTPNGQQAQGHGFNWPQCLSERDECVGPAAPGSGSSSRVHAPSLSLQRPSGRSPVFPTSRNFGGINEYTDLSEMHSLENYTRNGLAPGTNPHGVSQVVYHSHPTSGRRTPLARGRPTGGFAVSPCHSLLPL